jgi:RNA polymerase sigma-70 factor (ECF subfamily)
MTEKVFLRLWENLPRDIHRGGIQDVRAWLYRVAHNLMVDFYRSKKPEQAIDQFEDNLHGEPSPHEVIESQHLTREVIKAIQQLDEKSQHVILLRFLEGLSHKETASATGISEGHVRIIQFRALKKIKDLLGYDHE